MKRSLLWVGRGNFLGDRYITRDNGRARLTGTQKTTFGKAVIQTVEELDDGSAVVVTIAKYETPKRTNINQRGIFVDLERDCPKEATAAAACVADELKGLVASK